MFGFVRVGVYRLPSAIATRSPPPSGDDPCPSVVAVDGKEERGRHVEFEDFLGREWLGLSRYARVLSNDRHEAEDLLSEALEKAQRHWSRIAEMAEPRAYVHRILTTTAVSRRRTWFARHVRLTRSGELPDTGTEVSEFLRLERREQVAGLLTRLPPRQRAALALRYLFDRTDAEIAAQMRCSESAVRSQIARALATLRAAQDERG